VSKVTWLGTFGPLVVAGAETGLVIALRSWARELAVGAERDLQRRLAQARPSSGMERLCSSRRMSHCRCRLAPFAGR
jgi:hypothetical protein